LNVLIQLLLKKLHALLNSTETYCRGWPCASGETDWE